MSEPTQNPEELRGEWTSASGAERDSLCPGAHQAQRGLPDESTPDTEFGDKIHHALATGRPEGLDVEQRDIYESCLAIEKKLLIRFFGMEVAALKATPVVEKREWIGFQSDQDSQPHVTLFHSAQPDRVFRRGSRVLIIEFKTLPGEVQESSTNLQLRDQMTVIWNKVRVLKQDLTEVGVVVVQPLVTHDPQICLYQVQDFELSLKGLFERVVQSNNPGAQRVPGEAQCKFCKAKTRCLEYQRWAGNTVPQLAGSTLLDTPMAEWTPEQRARMCEALEVIDPFIKSAKRFLKEAIRQTPGSIPGWAVNEGRVVNKCTDPQKLAERVYALGVSPEQFLQAVDIVKSRLAQHVSDATGAVGVNLELAMRALYKDISTETRTEGWLVRKKEGK